MAKRKMKKSNTRSSKIEPAVLTFTAGIPVNPTSSVDATMDLSQVASLMNRRFYRQGLNWAVAGFKVKASQTGAIDIGKLPNTWTMANSWTKGFKTWQEMNKNALEETDSISGRFLDFKIYADSIHHASGYANNITPVDFAGNVLTRGEWIPSEIRVPNSITNNTTSGFELIAVGDNYPGAGASGKDAVSLIQGYANSRALPSISDPNSPAESSDAGPSATPENWMSALHNDGVSQDSDVIADITAYDLPPYPFENDGTAVTTMYPGGGTQLPALEAHDFQNFTGTTISKITYLKGGNFPCGLVRLKCTNTSDQPDVFIVQIDLVPGSHRGYMAESMLEM
ncbi:MAG: hypothetical protein [Circular genetic element sp.]|nr:MAG: hypothetical protein [Circular genetic element sp.]